jgi:peptidoglycan/LPS O-acetylase OafA/YrhL
MVFNNKRLRELDFLRGMAIILVLLRHQNISDYTTNMGWIGVDLFFVLSGYLVSGLLFREYLKFGNIEPKRFLIRRAFKIYPIYYLSYPIYLYQKIIVNKFHLVGFLSDMLFVQNYTWGFGYAYAANWSLAIEEHFYFAFAIVLWIALSKKLITLENNDNSGLGRVEKTILTMLVLCFIMRIASNLIFPNADSKNFTMTHLRIDSLLAGVLIAYFYYFKFDILKEKFNQYKSLLWVIAILCLSWTPFIDSISSFFVKTIGFTMLYIAFGVLLLTFLLLDDINVKLNRIFSKVVVSAVSKIGYCSFSIYIIHSFVNKMAENLETSYPLLQNGYFSFISTSLISVITGTIMTYTIESFFLKIRDKYYPSRSVKIIP